MHELHTTVRPSVFAVYESRHSWTRLNPAIAERCDFERFLEPVDAINAIVKEARSGGLDVNLREYEPSEIAVLAKDLRTTKNPLLWNLTDGCDFYAGSNLPALARLLRVAHLGSSSYVQMLCQNKQHLKLVAQGCGVPAVRGIVLHKRSGPSQIHQINFDGPFFVKPNRFDNGIGDTIAPPICQDLEAAMNTVNSLMAAGIDEVIVEQFLPGAEYTVIAAEAGQWILECAMIHHTGTGYFSSRDKDAGGYSCHFPEDQLSKKLVAHALRLVHHIGLHDYFRADFRCDSAGNPFFIEVNSNPFLVCSFFDALALRRFESRSAMIGLIVKHSYLRQNVMPIDQKNRPEER